MHYFENRPTGKIIGDLWVCPLGLYVTLFRDLIGNFVIYYVIELNSIASMA